MFDHSIALRRKKAILIISVFDKQTEKFGSGYKICLLNLFSEHLWCHNIPVLKKIQVLRSLEEGMKYKDVKDNVKEKTF